MGIRLQAFLGIESFNFKRDLLPYIPRSAYPGIWHKETEKLDQGYSFWKLKNRLNGEVRIFFNLEQFKGQSAERSV